MLEDEDVDVKPKITESDDWTTPGNFHGKSLTDEVKTVEVSAPVFLLTQLTKNKDKWQLLPAFLKTRGLVKQQYVDYFALSPRIDYISVSIPTTTL